MKWMLNVWFSIALFIFACLFCFVAEIARYYFVIFLIFTISYCLLLGGLAYIADLQMKNGNKKLSQFNKVLLLLFFFVVFGLIRSTGAYIPGSKTHIQHEGRLRSASGEQLK